MAAEPPENNDGTSGAPEQATAEEAEAQAALAEARAAAARARAAQLRRTAEAGNAPAVDGALAEPDPAAQSADPARRGAPSWRPMALAAALLTVCVLVGFSGYMAWQHHGANQELARQAEFAAVARQGVVNLMTLDFTNAAENVQTVIDSSTGTFKEEFEEQSEFLVQSLEESKVITEVTVESVAVESAADDAPVVLVAAQSQATNAQDARKDPQRFRVAVTLGRDGGELKLAQVEFL